VVEQSSLDHLNDFGEKFEMVFEEMVLRGLGP